MNIQGLLNEKLRIIAALERDCAALEAHLKGERIQVIKDGKWVDVNPSPGIQVFTDMKFRLAQYEPLSFHDAGMILEKKYVNKKGVTSLIAIHGVYLDGVEVGPEKVTFAQLLSDYTFDGGATIGTIPQYGTTA